MSEKVKNLLCKIGNSLLPEGFSLDNHLLIDIDEVQ